MTMMKLFWCTSVILTVLFAILITGFINFAEAEVITMEGTVTASYQFDIDSGQMGLPATILAGSDFWYHNVDGTERYLVPENGAKFANLGAVDFKSVQDFSAYTLSSEIINASLNNNSIPVDTVLVVRTNIGNYAKLRINSYPDPINFTIVYQNDGTTSLNPTPSPSDSESPSSLSPSPTPSESSSSPSSSSPSQSPSPSPKTSLVQQPTPSSSSSSPSSASPPQSPSPSHTTSVAQELTPSPRPQAGDFLLTDYVPVIAGAVAAVVIVATVLWLRKQRHHSSPTVGGAW